MEHQMSKFTAFREEGYPTLYGDQSQPFWLDLTLFRLTFIFVIVYIGFLAILPGFRGIERFYVFVRWTVAFMIAFVMLYCNLMPYWERSCLDVTTPYKAGSKQFLNASIGLNIGLRGINITLKGIPVKQHGHLLDYNEQFTWTWQQGSPGFDFNAGLFQKQFLSALKRGLPYPVLWIAEAFTVDHELIRIGRYYRQSGWYAHIFLWLGVPLFILANLLFQMVIQYGSVFMFFTGISLLVANLVTLLMRSEVPLQVSFMELGSMQTTLMQTHYSWCYYLNLINGITCILIGFITMFADLRYPDEAANFFGNDVLQSYEDYFAEPTEDKSVVVPMQPENGVQLRRKKQFNLQKPEEQEIVVRTGLKRRTISNRFSRFQKSTVRRVGVTHLEMKQRNNQPQASMPSTNENEKDYKHENKISQLYENFQHFDVIGEEDVAENEL